ncbi:MAG: DMT family transporter [Qingshengfaniella sp.]
MTDVNTSRNGTAAGMLWMVASMAAFATEDVFVKFLAQRLPVTQIMALLSISGGLVFILWARLRHQPMIWRDLLLPSVMWRNLGEVIGTFSFVTALALTPLSSASAILQATPLAVVLGAALFLGTRVGWRRWLAIGAGFGGVLLILRPGLDAFQPASLFAVAGVIGLSVRDLATRASPPRIPAQVLAAQGFALVGLVALCLLPFGPPPVLPSGSELLLLICATSTGVIGYYTLTMAMRQGDITLVTPFRYSRMLFAMGFGMVIFGERPDLATALGAAIIIGSGLYTLSRDRTARHAA